MAAPGPREFQETPRTCAWIQIHLALVALLLVGCDSTPPVPAEKSVAETAPRFRNATLPLEPPQHSTEVRPDDWFEEQTLPVEYHDGREAALYTLVETVGGGAALFDYDRDGLIEVFVCGGGTFSATAPHVHGRSASLVRYSDRHDVALAARLTDSRLYSHGCAVGDFDSDGFADLFVAGFSGVQVFQNQGDGTFEEVSERLQIESEGWQTGGAWADVTGDGLLDLFVMTYANWSYDPKQQCINDLNLRDVCAPPRYAGQADQLFLNRGDGTFANVSADAGVSPFEDRGLGLVAADWNQDGHVDFYVANDVQENRLFLGQSKFPFQEEALLKGVALSADGQRQGSMGVAVGDYDRDGWLDLYWANFATEDNSLFRNDAVGGFMDDTVRMGTAGMFRPWVGFGSLLADFDSDGWLDLFVSNGHVAYERQDAPYFQPPQLARNLQGQRFQEVSQSGGAYFRSARAGRGAATADLNGDGALDVVVVHQSAPVSVLLNRRAPTAWLGVQLVGTTCHRDAVGARIRLADEQPIQARFVVGGGSFVSHSDQRALFPLSESRSRDVIVDWPQGGRERFSALNPREWHVLRQGFGQSE